MQCPQHRALRRLDDEPGERPADASLERHLEACPRCQAVLERLARADPSTATTPFADDDAGDAEAWPEVPGFEDFREIGRGGAGVVYKARRTALDAWAAIKVLPGGRTWRREQGLREARAAARVRHPNVVRTFDVGLAGDRPYIVMEYVEGGTLADRLAPGSPIAPGVAARLVAILADAAEAIHREGLVHRDLKPSNVLLRDGAEVTLDRCDPLIGDFGLAREIDPSGSGDLRGGTGTPNYMAPEQVDGRFGSIGPATDVYALGSILYVLTAGRPPFRGKDAREVLRMTVEREPLPLRRLRPDVPRDLEAIASACLRKDPSRRYGSARALADDLRRFLDGRPVSARAAGLAERAWRRARRRPVASAAACVLLLAAVALPFVGVAFAGLRDRAEAGEAAARLSRMDARSGADAAARVVSEFAARIGEVEPRNAAALAVSTTNALAECRALLERRPDDAGLRRTLARLAHASGRLQGLIGDHVESLRLLEEAAAIGSRDVGRSPDDAAIRYAAGFYLRDHAQALIQAGRLDEAGTALGRHRDLLGPIRGLHDAEFRLWEGRLLAATALELGGRQEQARRDLADLQRELEASVAAEPGVAWAWGILAAARQRDWRFLPAVEAQRRCFALQPEDGETAVQLIGMLIDVARETRDSQARRPILVEADAVLADHVGRLERTLARTPGDVPAGRALASFQGLAGKLAEERARLDDPSGTFAGRLLAAIEAESGRPPVDGGWLASSCEELTAEYATQSGLPGSAAAGEGRGEPSAGWATLDFERGLGLLERGRPVAGRARLFEALARSTFLHRDRGDRARAAKLGAIARAGVAATTPGAADEVAYHRAAVQVWTHSAKNDWDVDRRAAREALVRATASARVVFDREPEAAEARTDLDRALARLSRFECEDGDYAAAKASLDRRAELWPPDSAEAATVAGDARKLADEAARRRSP
ncbi:serine/threonine-protein kinase [Paludisphaera soli]|uniref:serine/threonine-protein kinase n=1 Tax=Paludisphaera soli TaxID=2712865 RepID=UPI0013E9B3C6|nr:serine/threonine-protein kinase [Paludisphaera soli]